MAGNSLTPDKHKEPAILGPMEVPDPRESAGVRSLGLPPFVPDYKTSAEWKQLGSQIEQKLTGAIKLQDELITAQRKRIPIAEELVRDTMGSKTASYAYQAERNLLTDRLARKDLLERTRANLLSSLKEAEALPENKAAAHLKGVFEKKWLAYKNLNLIINDSEITDYRESIREAQKHDRSLGPSTSLPSCQALEELVNTERQGGKDAVLNNYSWYGSSLNHLNSPYETSERDKDGNPIRISPDWMLRSAGASGATGDSVSAQTAQGIGHAVWKTYQKLTGQGGDYADIDTPYKKQSGEIAEKWKNNPELTLDKLFSPSLEKCQEWRTRDLAEAQKDLLKNRPK